MITAFRYLTDEESELMIKVPVLVTVLIAAADNNIENNEKKWAIKLAGYRRFSSHPILHDYYQAVNKKFEEELNRVISNLPSGPLERNQFLSSELEKINDILPKIDIHFAEKFYESLLSFAKQVAEASGGILRFATIGKDEKELIDLKMIHPPQL